MTGKQLDTAVRSSVPTVHQRNSTSCDGVCQEISNYFFRASVSSLASSAVGAGGRELAAVVLWYHRRVVGIGLA